MLVGIRVEIVSPYETLLLSRGNSEGSDAGHDVAYHLAFFEEVAEPLVLGVEACVPVHLRKVKIEDAALLVDLDVQVVGPVEHLVLEGAVCVLGAHIVQLVDDGAHGGVLVGEDGGNEVLVGEIALSEVKVGDMARQGEAGGDLVVVLLLGRRYDGTGDLRVGEVVVVQVQLEGNDADGAGLLELLQTGAPGVSICLRSGSVRYDGAGGVAMSRTVVQHFWLEDQALDTPGSAVGVRVVAHAVEARLQGVAAPVEGVAHAGNVPGVEDAGGRGGDGALEECAVQHLHGAVDGRCEHVGGVVGHGVVGQRLQRWCLCLLPRVHESGWMGELLQGSAQAGGRGRRAGLTRIRV